MLFSKKWPKNHPKFLLHFLIHIDVLMLCSKFELFPTNIFQVTGILRNQPISEKNLAQDYKKWLQYPLTFSVHFQCPYATVKPSLPSLSLSLTLLVAVLLSFVLLVPLDHQLHLLIFESCKY